MEIAQYRLGRLSTRLLPLLIVTLLAGAMLLVACSGDDDQQQSVAQQDQEQERAAPSSPAEQQQQSQEQQAVATAAPTQQQQEETRERLEDVEGEIQVDGSSTVFPITEAMAEEFGNLTDRDVRVTVGVSGTGGGFKRFCAGETDISNASRPIKQSEVELCTEAGIDFIEVPVAFDGLTVVINPDNDWVDFLTVDELNHIFRPDDFAITWADVRAGFPDVEIALYAPGADSGTFDYFTEAINGDGGVHRSDNTTFSEDDNVLVQGVSNDRGGVGYFGFSYYANNSDALRAVPVVNDAGQAITPSNETINDGSYNPLSRPLFIYVSVASLERDEVAEFVTYYLTDGVWLVDTPEVGYVQLPVDIYVAALNRVEDLTTGSAMAAATEGMSLAAIFGVEESQSMVMDLSDLEGEIQVDGSSTVFPITEAMAEEFGILTDRGVRVTVGVSGTGGGFKRFCAGETDISDASRPIKESEVELCTEAGIDFIEVPVAFDGLTVVINPDNDWVDFLTVDELNHIFRPDDFATSWADVRDGFPDVEIALYAPGADSGTFDYFTEAINGDGGVHRSDNTTFSEDDNVLVQGVSADRGGIGYFGFSYYANNADVLKAVPVVNDAGNAVTPSNGTINDGSYNPLSRPLFIYVSVSSLERDEVTAFVEYFLTDGVWLVDTPEVGYVQLPEAIYAAALERVHNGETGSAIHNAPEGATLAQIFGAESMPMAMDLSSLEGEIAVDGSSTVFPITEAMAEEFGILTERGVRVTVGVSGTGGGFKRFCAGETDISDASRPIKDSEVELCAEAGIDFIEVPVAFDGLTVVINPDNDWVDFLTVEELNHIFRPDDYAVTWADVRDGFPDVEIALYAPGADSGTFDYFTEAINGDGGVHRSDNTTFSEDDNVLVQGVSADRGGIGYFGFSYYANNADVLKAVPVVNDAGEAITPSNGTINDGTYNPLSRPLFIYVSVASLEREEVVAFVQYFLTDGVWLVDTPEVGYVQLPQPIYAAALERVLNGVTGSAVAEAGEGATLASTFGAG